jgi:hypothetical protein
MKKLILSVLLLATAFAGQAHGLNLTASQLDGMTDMYVDMSSYRQDCPASDFDRDRMSRWLSWAIAILDDDESNSVARKAFVVHNHSSDQKSLVEKLGVESWCVFERPFVYQALSVRDGK